MATFVSIALILSCYWVMELCEVLWPHSRSRKSFPAIRMRSSQEAKAFLQTVALLTPIPSVVWRRASVLTAAMGEGTARKISAGGCILQTKTSSTLLLWPSLTLCAVILMMPGLVAGADQVGDSGVYSQAAVATDAAPCSKIGVDILKKGGGAVDAAISSLLCVGLVNLHSTGIGGGGFMLFYDASSREVHALDYREVAPHAASYDMYDDLDPTASHIGVL